MAPKLTQSQKDVLALYRKGMRLIRTKPEPSRPSFRLYLRYFFAHPSQGGGLTRRDFAAVDHMLRRGARMVDQIFGESGVKSVTLPPGATNGWDTRWRRSK